MKLKHHSCLGHKHECLYERFSTSVCIAICMICATTTTCARKLSSALQVHHPAAQVLSLSVRLQVRWLGDTVPKCSCAFCSSLQERNTSARRLHGMLQTLELARSGRELRQIDQVRAYRLRMLHLKGAQCNPLQYCTTEHNH